jgi:hypothetical protein
MKKNDSDEEVCADSRQLAISVCPEEWVRYNRYHNILIIFIISSIIIITINMISAIVLR